MRARIGWNVVLCGSLLVPGVAAAAGASGRVVDEQKNPIQGASACAVVGGVDQLCGTTDVDGRYLLPGGASDIRIVARGYLPKTVTGVDLQKAITLERAAALRIRLLDDGTGKGLPQGKVSLVYTTGRTLGPFPVNANGLVLPTLPRGEIRAEGRADGYRGRSSDTLELEAGKEKEIVVRLEHVPPGENAAKP